MPSNRRPRSLDHKSFSASVERLRSVRASLPIGRAPSPYPLPAGERVFGWTLPNGCVLAILAQDFAEPMPKRTDISTILIIGAGPIVIGQACEFDYSGTQACKALKAEGYRIVLVNSNPATIMTDPDLADATYIEPITPEIV